MDHTHTDPHLHVTTCPRCAREWELRRATDPLHVEAPEPPRRWRYWLRCAWRASHHYATDWTTTRCTRCGRVWETR